MSGVLAGPSRNASGAYAFAAVDFGVGPVDFGVGPVAFDVGTFAILAGGAGRVSGPVALTQLRGDIVSERVTNVGEHVGDLCQQLSRRSERSALVVVAGVQDDAKALRDGRS